MTFVTPEVVDYGTLDDPTQAAATVGIDESAAENDTEEGERWARKIRRAGAMCSSRPR